MEQKYKPIAKSMIPKEYVHIGDGLIALDRTIAKLGSSGDNVVAALVLEGQTTNVATLRDMQNLVAHGTPDDTRNRNLAYDVCFTDHIGDMMQVQMKANNITNFEEAAAFIIRNGFDISTPSVRGAAPDISIKQKPNFAQTIIAQVKALKTTKKYSIDWEYSYDNGETWFRSNSTAVCIRDIKNLTPLKALIVRARYNVGNDDPTDWIISNSINIWFDPRFGLRNNGLGLGNNCFGLGNIGLGWGNNGLGLGNNGLGLGNIGLGLGNNGLGLGNIGLGLGNIGLGLGNIGLGLGNNGFGLGNNDVGSHLPFFGL